MVSMVAEFKIDWARAIEDAAIEYADAYTELQCDADNDHQREHLKALKDLRETIKRGLEVAAAPQPAARGVPEGWKIVPKVATTEMILALMGTGLRHAEYKSKAASPSVGELRDGYCAALAAAPQPAAQPDRHPIPSPDSTGLAVVDMHYYWRPIDAATPRGTKMQLINRAAGVATLGALGSDPGHWTHWAPLPTFGDRHVG